MCFCLSLYDCIICYAKQIRKVFFAFVDLEEEKLEHEYLLFVSLNWSSPNMFYDHIS